MSKNIGEDCLTEEAARRYLRDIEPAWRRFWFHMHLMAKNLEEFAMGMGEISDEVFDYHCSGQKNDLAAWVQEVVGDSALARHLESLSAREPMAAACRARVAELKDVLK